jgi:hypothetical protein
LNAQLLLIYQISLSEGVYSFAKAPVPLEEVEAVNANIGSLAKPAALRKIPANLP